MSLSHYEIERLLKRVETGTTTERDALLLRRILLGDTATAPVAPSTPTR